MDQIEITWARALKIWWSFSWRAWVPSLLVVVPLDIFLSILVMGRARSTTDSVDAMRMLAPFVLLWPLVIVAVIALQAQAMRWALHRARWSDFRVAVLPRGS